jgi:DNA processing protein
VSGADEPTEDRLARVALAASWEPGDAALAALIEQRGAVEALRIVRSRTGPGARRVAALARLDLAEPERVLQQATQAGIRHVVPGDDEWPEALDVLVHVDRDGSGGRPLGLWVTGPLHLADALRRSASVVGSRAVTAYGEYVATDLGAGLAERGATVGVLACGVDVAYPRGNADLLHRIAADGLLVSEVPPGATPTRPRFLTRNRLIAAMTPGTVLVEAAARSGALNTARWALECDRRLMGVPGPVTSSSSAGVHEELRRGATLVTDAAEVLDLIGEFGADAAEEPRGPGRPWDDLPPVAAKVFEALPARGTAGLGELCARAPAAPRECLAALGLLVTRGLVEPDGAGWRLSAAVRRAAADARGAP